MFSFSFFVKSFSLISMLSKPSKPISSEHNAFWIDSLKFLPMAIDSPTDFIAVPNIGFVFLNFSNANLGIFVTI